MKRRSQMKESVLRLWPQWLAALAATLLTTSMGMAVGWTSPYLAQLTSDVGEMKISQDEASWVASLLPLGRLFGAVSSAICVEYFGSKLTLTTAALPLILGWLCIMFANSVIWLYISRVASGMAMGIIFGCFSLYIGEISEPSIRGGLVGLVVNGMPLGTLFGNLMGPYMSMMWFGIVCLVLTVSFIIIFPFLPQSPHYLVQRNSLEKAEEALKWYCRKEDVSSELAAIEKYIHSSQAVGIRQRIRHILEPKNRRAFSIIILLFSFMQLSGLNTIVFYMEIILRKAQVTSVELSTIVIIVNVNCIIVGWISMYTVDHCGRRLLLAISSISITISMGLLGLHFALLDCGLAAGSLQWLPILALMIFPVMCIGFIPIPSTMLSELFPADLKSIAGFVASMMSASIAFASSKTYQPMVNVMAEQYVFWIYGAVMIVCAIYCVIAVPETKGKTLQEIQEMLTKESEARPRTNQTIPAQPEENGHSQVLRT